MKITAAKRRVIFSIYLGLFLIFSPIFLLYTAGIRWTPTLGFVKTGTFYIASTPKSAEVFIDGKNTGEKTPTVLKHLLPGTYNVELKTGGAITWSKNLSIKSGETTFANTAYLFNESLPKLVISSTISAVAFGNDAVAWTNNQSGWTEVWLSELPKPNKTLVYRSAGKSKLGLRFSNNALLVNEGENVSAFNMDGTIARYSSPLVFVNRINRTDVYPADKTKTAPLLSLPYGSWEAREQKNDNIIVVDKNRSRLTVVNIRESAPIFQTAARLFDFYNNDTLLFASDTEISTFHIPSKTTTLIERLSSTPTLIRFHPDGQIIFLGKDDSIIALETDERDGRRNTSIVNDFSLIGFSISSDGRVLYLAGSNGTDNGIFTFQLF